ncbi:MAG TPA: T9SS type A sorting domain-containing protein [Bacteroidetes bacterium]|nr:T9SS type A sorting domain-containing protein [Bacteroidota bacterium]
MSSRSVRVGREVCPLDSRYWSRVGGPTPCRRAWPVTLADARRAGGVRGREWSALGLRQRGVNDRAGRVPSPAHDGNHRRSHPPHRPPMTLASTRLALLVALAISPAAAPAAQAWPSPGEGFDWETVGGFPVNATDLALDDLGRLWTFGTPYEADLPEAEGIAILRLDLNDRAAEWEAFDPLFAHGDAVLPLGRGDTVITASNAMRRTTDGGATWAYVPSWDRGFAEVLLEVPFGTTPAPGGEDLSGVLFVAGYNTEDLHRSDDRGATWTPVPFLAPNGRSAHALLLVPEGHAFAGRLLLGTWEAPGLWVSDVGADGRLAMRPGSGGAPGPGWAVEHLAAFPAEAAGSAPGPFRGRLLATGYFANQPDRRAFVSDDGGETWRETARLPEPVEGIPGDAHLAAIGPSSALAIGGRGIVYRTDDGGETWAVVGRTPVTGSGMTSRRLLVGPKGRLYVALYHGGTTNAWVVRTSAAVTVAVSGEAAASAPGAIGLSVTPNPTRTHTTARWRQASAGETRVSVYDARGREVLVLADGHRPAGEQTAEFSTGTLAPGVYVVRVASAEGTASAPLTVAR